MNFCLPEPTLTEANQPSQYGKVFIVTGSSSGFGKELASILYQSHAKVYVAVRSETKALAAINELKSSFPTSKGELIYMHLDLADLSTVQKSAHAFQARETRLEVLWNNAGVMVPPEGSKTVQGYELQLGVNTLGTFLFTWCLRPLMAATAATAPRNSVRVVWVSSMAAKEAPKPPVDLANLDYTFKDESQSTKYRRSKAGIIMVAAECGKLVARDGIVSIGMEPGLAKTELQRTMPVSQRLFVSMAGFEPIKGAYTEFYAGLSSDITTDIRGQWVVPCGRLQPYRKDLQDEELCARYYAWVEAQVRPYMCL